MIEVQWSDGMDVTDYITFHHSREGAEIVQRTEGLACLEMCPSLGLGALVGKECIKKPPEVRAGDCLQNCRTTPISVVLWAVECGAPPVVLSSLSDFNIRVFGF